MFITNLLFICLKQKVSAPCRKESKEKSEELYGKAITFAELLDDEVLVQRINKKKKKNDFSNPTFKSVVFILC